MLERSLSVSSEHKDAVDSIARMRVLRDSCVQAQTSSSSAQGHTPEILVCTDAVSVATGMSVDIS